MHRSKEDGAGLYLQILKKSIKFTDLDRGELYELYGYLCNETEQGRSVDKKLMRACARAIAKPQRKPDAVTESVYARLGIRGRSLPRRRILQRALVAILTVLTFLLSSFFTALALDVDIIESVKTVITPKREMQILFEDHSVGKTVPETKTYANLELLFDRELSGFYFPASMPEGVKPYKVAVPAYGDVIYMISFKSAQGEDWTVTARDAESAVMPMGFECRVGERDFVYTLSRKGNEIIKYDLYTVIDGVQYCLSLRTDDWNEVTGVLESLTEA